MFKVLYAMRIILLLLMMANFLKTLQMVTEERIYLMIPIFSCSVLMLMLPLAMTDDHEAVENLVVGSI